MPAAELPRVCIVGATGAVGREALALLAARSWPADRVTAYCSARSAGTRLPFGAATVTATALPDDHATAFDGCGVALLMANAHLARLLLPYAHQAGALVIDNSSAFRMTPEIPLVVPEVNGDLLATDPPPRVVANPNCSTILLTVAVEPLRRLAGLRRVVVASYQAVSGAGLAAVTELETQTRAALDGTPAPPEHFPEPCAFNVFSHESATDPRTGHNVEEQKIVAEARRIWDLPELRIAPTCVRVPVRRAHSQAITLELEQPVLLETVRAAYAAAPGITVCDDRELGQFPTPLRASNRDDVLVGRLRAAADAIPDADGKVRDISLFACADQLIKGAAGNAWQIAERLLSAS